MTLAAWGSDHVQIFVGIQMCTADTSSSASSLLTEHFCFNTFSELISSEICILVILQRC